MSKFIKETKTTIKSDVTFSRKKGMMKSSAAVIAAAEKQNKTVAREIGKQIEEAIIVNMFKYKGFGNVFKYLIRNIINPLISQAKVKYNITDSYVSACKKKDCDKIREKYEILLLVPLYIFMDEKRVVDIGAGHLLAENTIGQNYKKIMTDVINIAANGGLPDTVMDYANIFTDLYSSSPLYSASNILRKYDATIGGTLEFTPFYREGPRSRCNLELYTGFWYAYLYSKGSLKLKCSTGESDCDKETMTSVVYKGSNICEVSSCRKVQIIRPPCNDPNFSEKYNISACCNFIQNISSDRAAMLRVLKFSIQSPHLLESEEEEMSVFQNISKAIPNYLTLKPNKDTRRNFNPFIPLCQYGGEPKLLTFRSCNMFSRAYTDMGIGFSFNTEMFANIYKDTEVNIQANEALFFNKEKQVVYPKASGKKLQLKIVIDANNEEVEYSEKNYENIALKPKPFLLTVHDPSSPASLRSEGIEVAPGYETTVLITPRILETTYNAKTALNSVDRKCKTKQENHGLKLFKIYTTESCLLECHLTEAADQCDCTPWNYPHVPGSQLCDALGIHCFEKVLDQLASNSSCYCPNNCDGVTYSLVGTAMKLEENLLCSNKPAPKDIFYDFYQHDALPKKFIALYNFIVNKQEYEEKELCIKKLKYRAIVNFQIATRSVSRTTQDLKHSFADKVSNFGKQTHSRLHICMSLFRWDSRLVHWHEHSQHGGDSVLDLQVKLPIIRCKKISHACFFSGPLQSCLEERISMSE